MRIKLTRQYLHWPPGSVVNLGSGVAQTLIDHGRAELAEPEAKRVGRPPRNKAIHGAEVKHGVG